MDFKKSWEPKNWCFWTVVLKKTCESPLDCKEIKLVNSKGDQSWIFFGTTDAEAETPILWPSDVKNWLIGKDPDAGKDWEQEEKGETEGEMVAAHGIAKSRTQLSNWTTTTRCPRSIWINTPRMGAEDGYKRQSRQGCRPARALSGFLHPSWLSVILSCLQRRGGKRILTLKPDDLSDLQLWSEMRNYGIFILDGKKMPATSWVSLPFLAEMNHRRGIFC